MTLSFVYHPEDPHDLRYTLDKLGHSDIDIIAKVERADVIHNLAQILIAGLELPKFGILVASDDLVIEVGFENLAFVQEDILCLYEAAHIPVILAAQVLDSFEKWHTNTG